MAYVKVRVRAGCRRESVEQVNDHWTIAVRERPERGEANARVKTLLARHLKVPERALRLIKGATTPSKLYLLTNHTDHEHKL